MMCVAVESGAIVHSLANCSKGLMADRRAHLMTHVEHQPVDWPVITEGSCSGSFV